jgi:hypothetical protein
MRDVPQVGHTLFVVVPYWVLEHPVVHSSRTVLHVYGAMYLDGNFKERESIVRWERIAARTGLQRSTIFRDVRSMIDAGLIRKVSDGRYQLPMDDPCAESTTMDSESTTVDLQSTTVDRASLTENSENSRGALARAQIDAQFDTTWKLYPRKRARDRALAAFRERITDGIGPEDLFSAVENFAAAHAGHDKQFLPYGARFFGPEGEWRDWVNGDPDRSTAPISVVDPAERFGRETARWCADACDARSEILNHMPDDPEAQSRAMTAWRQTTGQLSESAA